MMLEVHVGVLLCTSVAARLVTCVPSKRCLCVCVFCICSHATAELSLDVGELLIQPASKPTGCANGGPVPCTAESLTPQSPLLSTSSPFSQSSSPSPDASTSSNCSRSGSSGGGSSNSDSLSDLDLLSSSSHTSLLAAAESLEHGLCGGGSVDLFSGSLFSMPDLGTDDIFADLFDNNVHRFLPPGPVLS
eukprot:scpid74977/ scgid2599/ 